MSNTKFITCTLPYANSKPHIGHAFEFIIGDALSRHFRAELGSENVHFNIGLDEHGKKIHDAAIAAGKPTQQFLNELTIEWEQFCTMFNIEYNSFYRTSSPKHYEEVTRFWNNCLEQNLIYKKKYTGTYCVGCESFKLEKDLVDGKCPDHPTTPLQSVEEENYFFALTRFKDDLLKWIDTECELVPSNKLSELRNVIIEGEDISISRKAENVPWGIPVPNDSDQVIYVWAEALLNYIFVAGYYDNPELFKVYWDNSIQIFGPDNLRFQGALFQYLLKAAGAGHTKKLLCHGTILDKNGQKMSKSVGNVIDPIDQVNKYGIDAVRYYALAGLQVYDNSGWSEERLIALYNDDLANNFGNLITRVVHLMNLKEVSIIDPNLDKSLELHLFNPLLEEVQNLWDNCDINGALNVLKNIVTAGNKYIQEREPWKSDRNDYVVTLKTLHYLLLSVANYLEPVIPNKIEEVFESLQTKTKAVIFPRIIV